MKTIVVGVDGSENSKAALAWAVSEARIRGDSVNAVLAWHEPYADTTFGLPLAVDIDDFEKSHRLRLDSIMEESGVDTSGVEVTSSLAHGTPAASLLAAAKDADLLVVGARGHGGFVGLLLGSVSAQIVAHAPCPVVVVPGPDEG